MLLVRVPSPKGNRRPVSPLASTENLQINHIHHHNSALNQNARDELINQLRRPGRANILSKARHRLSRQEEINNKFDRFEVLDDLEESANRNTPTDLLCEECEVRISVVYCEQCDQVFCPRCDDLCHQTQFDKSPHPHVAGKFIRPIEFGDESSVVIPRKEFSLPEHYEITAEELMVATGKDLCEPNSLAMSVSNMTLKPVENHDSLGDVDGTPKLSVNEYVVFYDPVSRKESFGQIISDLDLRHSVGETIIRGGSLTVGILYRIVILGVLSDDETCRVKQLNFLCRLQENVIKQKLNISIVSKFIDTSQFKAVLDLPDVPHRNRFKVATAIDAAVRDIELLRRVGNASYRYIQKNGLIDGKFDHHTIVRYKPIFGSLLYYHINSEWISMYYLFFNRYIVIITEPPEGHDPDLKFVNIGFIPAPTDQPEKYLRPPSSLITKRPNIPSKSDSNQVMKW